MCLLQEFLICIEMFVAALAHAYAFPPSDYSDPLHPPHGLVRMHYRRFCPCSCSAILHVHV